MAEWSRPQPGWERTSVPATRLAPRSLSVRSTIHAKDTNISSGRVLALAQVGISFPETEGFPFLLLSENVIIDDDSLTHFKINHREGGNDGDDVWVADVDDGAHSA